MSAEDFDAAVMRSIAGIEKKRSLLHGVEKEVVAKHEVRNSAELEAAAMAAVRSVCAQGVQCWSLGLALRRLMLVPRVLGKER